MGPDISNFVMPGKASVMYDGQFGSTGKGLAGAWIGEHNEIDWCTTNASANAGHTSIIDGEPVVLFHIPSSFLTARHNNYCRVFINKGAIIDLDVLIGEIEMLGLNYDQIFVDPNAAIILPEDKEDEVGRWSPQTKIASTQKGCGAALARKVLRQGPNLGLHLAATRKKVPFQLKPVSMNGELASGKSVMIEVPQGFSLSLGASGFYPYTTSRDCTLQQGMSDAGVHPRFFHKSMAVIRTFPIRVGNIKDSTGKQTGFSGRGYPDQVEKTWEEMGQTPEVTTVTKRVRRIFTFSQIQYEEMLQYSRPDLVFLNFANYFGSSPNKLRALSDNMRQVEHRLGLNPIVYYGYGPASGDIREYMP